MKPLVMPTHCRISPDLCVVSATSQGFRLVFKGRGSGVGGRTITSQGRLAMIKQLSVLAVGLWIATATTAAYAVPPFSPLVNRNLASNAMPSTVNSRLYYSSADPLPQASPTIAQRRSRLRIRQCDGKRRRLFGGHTVFSYDWLFSGPRRLRRIQVWRKFSDDARSEFHGLFDVWLAVRYRDGRM